MLIDKIKNWLQKRGYDIHAEVSPAIDFFGVIKFSLAKVTVDHTNPDEWSEEERKAIADILKSELNTSLDEFSKCLKEELNKITKEESDSILDKIAELITEKPLIPLREFEERSEIKQLLEYKKFIGREAELKELHTFLADKSRKIMVVSGEGGTGKTRLALEFARQIEDKNWSGYFIHPNKPFKYFGALPSSGKFLLILDDVSRYIERDKLIDFVLNPPLDIDIKLLLIDRTIFKDRIESNLREKGVFVEAYEIKKGDIISFLEEYFEIEENKAVEIERECLDSFVWAAFFAEFYREEGRIDELRKVLINRTEKYIRDLEIRATGMTIEDVKNSLSLLSLVTPVKWKEDKKYFEEISDDVLPAYEYKHLKRIIGLAGETNILLKSDGEYAIKPDPVADFLRTEFMRDKRFPRLLNGLLPYMPLRISYNIGVIPRFKAEIEEVFTVLGNIWLKLNRIKGQTPEYFSALVLFTGDFAHLPFFDINEANMSLWIESYKDIRRAHPEKEVRENLAIGLCNATIPYGRADKFEKMEECLQELRKLHDAHPEKEVREKLASGLFNATSPYGRADKFEKMEECLQELRKLHDAHPEEKEVREELAKGLVNATGHYGRADKFEKMEECLQELRTLHDAHPEEKEVREELAKGLVNTTGHYGRADKFEKMEECLQELRTLHDAHPEEKEVREKLAICLFNATSHYVRADKFEKMEECLQELRKLHDAHPEEKEVRENLAKGLFNATNPYGRADKFEKMEECLQELRKLHDAHPEEKEVRESLAKGLVNATNHYGRADKFEKMEECLQELRKLHDAHPEEKEVREELASGLFNATSPYGRADKFEKMEACLQELRKLHDAHPEEKEVRENLASGLFNATNHYVRADKFEKMEECLQELRTLHDAHPEEKEVREELAKGLVNATHYLGDRAGGYENLFLLFVLRFDLPDDSNRERFIKIIEDLLIKETIKIVEDKYKEGEEHLAEFIDWMKAEIENQTELVLLLDKISEKLDFKVQKKLWALLT